MEKIRINTQIRAPELRVLGPNGENLGVMATADALAKAIKAELDIIEISPRATPPVAKIGDYGKFQYEQNKKQKEIKSKAHVTETKGVQVKIGTGDHDLELKSRRASEWLSQGHRVKVDLFLWGRYKYMEFDFLKERLERFLVRITEPYKISDPVQKSPKGLTVTLEKGAKTK